MLVLHETLLVPLLLYGSETMLWKEKEISNLGLCRLTLGGIRRMDRVPNIRIRKLCRVKRTEQREREREKLTNEKDRKNSEREKKKEMKRKEQKYRKKKESWNEYKK